MECFVVESVLSRCGVFVVECLFCFYCGMFCCGIFCCGIFCCGMCWLWNLFCGVIVVDYLMWDMCCGIFVVESFVVEYVLWNLCCGVIVVE